MQRPGLKSLAQWQHLHKRMDSNSMCLVSGIKRLTIRRGLYLMKRQKNLLGSKRDLLNTGSETILGLFDTIVGLF
jgi:hypothetical protein